ncbi:hypothetical protein KRR38_22225 [Novosphingobium sp. G106]|uniref:hypothetical protein n=1 Tax=Novosphingobium sp. G106 TaxID=2849500 RepID=UPI001C2DD394|nr:hypothetical protein [Novosphingobium sp. G106]MBV1690325.1 hypothetical protein [Novosphingobium sp. G106]
MDDLESRLGAADEFIIAHAMDNDSIGWPIKDRAEFLEAFNRILDELGVPDAHRRRGGPDVSGSISP